HSLVATCTRLGRTDPAGSPCADALAARDIDLVARTSAIGDRMVRAVERIKRRAPGATVAVVGYLRLVPSTGRCADLPFAQGDYAHGRRVIGALNAALERAARRTGALFVDMHAASAGHDVCAAEPWVNGRRTIEGEALAYHPLAEGMEAAADELLAQLPG
ncbi:MAG: GDSL-type esterase/lipase family protein, partial [Nocardioidaceae bacterium]